MIRCVQCPVWQVNQRKIHHLPSLQYMHMMIYHQIYLQQFLISHPKIDRKKEKKINVDETKNASPSLHTFNVLNVMVVFPI